MKKNKILITGGAGFIGSNLAKFLLKKNFKINVIDNLSNGKISNLPKKIKFFKGDVRNKMHINKIAKGCSSIIHLAAISSLQRTINKPEECMSNNVLGTANIIDFCIQNKVKLIFASTCAVYPLKLKHNAKEKEHGNYQTPYAISKITCENLINFYLKENKIKSVILRFFNVYGENQNPDSIYSAVIPKFVKQANSKIPLTIYNKGNQKRDFININDICRAILKSIYYKKSDTFNIGTGKAISINSLAKIIAKFYVKIKIERKNISKFDALFSCANMYKTHSKLKFRSRISLEEGLKKII